MYRFRHHRPATVDEAARIFSDCEDPAYLGGGMTLIPTMKQRLAAPTDLIDLGRVDGLSGIRVSGEEIRIGAFTRHADVAASREVIHAIPALASLARQIGDMQVRNRGTIGGSVANSDPAADYPAAVVALGATVHTNRRRIAGDDFFKDLFETALEPGEIITAIDFPIPARAAYRKFPQPASRYAIVGVMVAELGGKARVGVTGAGPCAFRATALEEALNRGFDAAHLEGVEIPDAGFNTDMHASAEYRAHLVGVMAGQALAAL
ncbi:MAG: xanthine dehydrogenase family protein subunit M [Pseudomonadales bacterium]|nr:xanthine dehydrogenase family protein subunit M [Pseudomonadales bacterium]MCP5182889.1 xanthine dehydrogenase family protein subunit M [Pseudomonadales bacterium]